jgi:hypothetical protein
MADHDARAYRWHEGTYYAACSCGWRTRPHYDEERAEADAELHAAESSREAEVSACA